MLYQDCKPAPFGVMPGAVKKAAVMNMHKPETTTTSEKLQHNMHNHQEPGCASHMVYDQCDHHAFGMMPDEVKKSPVPLKKSPVPVSARHASKLFSWALPKLPYL